MVQTSGLISASMKRALVAIGWFTVVAIATDPAPAAVRGMRQVGLVRDNTIQVDGVTRRYHYYQPATDGVTALPLVFLLHGHGGSADMLSGQTAHPAPFKLWMELAESEKILLVYPDGMAGPDHERGWNDCRADATTNPTSDDVAFIRSLIQHMRTQFQIDPRRIYAAGFSNGGHMALRLALELPEHMAAVGAVAAAMPAKSECRAFAQPVSVLFMNGTADILSPYNGGYVARRTAGRGTVRSTPESVQFWADMNRTRPVVISELPDLNPRDRSSIRRHDYNGGTRGTEVALYEVIGGGHFVPSRRERFARADMDDHAGQNHDIEATATIWEFFRNKRLAGSGTKAGQ